MMIFLKTCVSKKVFLSAAFIIVHVVVVLLAKKVTVSNIQLPKDTSGKPLITGEASVLESNNKYYFYFNDWGSCPGVDCCDTPSGCASCCFKGTKGSCVYTNNHNIVVYETTDFETWQYRGIALNISNRMEGIMFRPHVIYNKKSDRYIMWYEDRHPGQAGYAIAVSKTPTGPFYTIINSVKMHGEGRSDGSGDFSIFVDEKDLKAYHVRDGFVIEELSDDYLGGTGNTYTFKTPENAEGPVFFKGFNGMYYILPGTSCCSCKGGSSIYVYVSKAPLGPYAYLGDVGRNTSTLNQSDIHNEYRYITRAQATAVFKVGKNQLIWMGNQWVTSKEPGNPRNHDLLYWHSLEFTDSGHVQQVQYQDSVVIEV
jgi:hypothetical protein